MQRATNPKRSTSSDLLQSDLLQFSEADEMIYIDMRDSKGYISDLEKPLRQDSDLVF